MTETMSTQVTEEKQRRWQSFLAREDQVRDQMTTRLAAPLALAEMQLEGALRAGSLSKRVEWLRTAADTMGEAIRPMAACRSACSHCCHIPVTIHSSEAQQIAEEIGVKALDVPVHLRDLRSTRVGYDYPCSFLVEGRCSIYESRPLPCRTLWNMDRDALLCTHTEQSNRVPYVDMRWFDMAAVVALGPQQGYLADVRDFFPVGTKKTDGSGRPGVGS